VRNLSNVKLQNKGQRWLRQSASRRRQCHNNNCIFGSRSHWSMPINRRTGCNASNSQQNIAGVRVFEFVFITPLRFPTHLSLICQTSPLSSPHLHKYTSCALWTPRAPQFPATDCYTIVDYLLVDGVRGIPPVSLVQTAWTGLRCALPC